jgi:hypothetical protein
VQHGAAAEAETPQEDEGTRIAGYGFGLPLSRLYARYFGGDVVLRAVPQYGTCASVLLSTTKRTFILHEAQKGAETVARVESQEYDDSQ